MLAFMIVKIEIFLFFTVLLGNLTIFRRQDTQNNNTQRNNKDGDTQNNILLVLHLTPLY